MGCHGRQQRISHKVGIVTCCILCFMAVMASSRQVPWQRSFGGPGEHWGNGWSYHIITSTLGSRLSEFGAPILQESTGSGWWLGSWIWDDGWASTNHVQPCAPWRRLTLAPLGMEWHTPNGLMLYDGYWAENWCRRNPCAFLVLEISTNVMWRVQMFTEDWKQSHLCPRPNATVL